MEDPPLTIPNREVKLHGADGTAARWESRLAPNSESLMRNRQAFFVLYREQRNQWDGSAAKYSPGP